MEKRSIKIEFLNIPDFALEEFKGILEIDEDALVSEIRSVNPQVIILMICYSHYLNLKSLLERVGLLPTLRIKQDLNILSNGQNDLVSCIFSIEIKKSRYGEKTLLRFTIPFISLLIKLRN